MENPTLLACEVSLREGFEEENPVKIEKTLSLLQGFFYLFMKQESKEGMRELGMEIADAVSRIPPFVDSFPEYVGRAKALLGLCDYYSAIFVPKEMMDKINLDTYLLKILMTVHKCTPYVGSHHQCENLVEIGFLHRENWGNVTVYSLTSYGTHLAKRIEQSMKLLGRNDF